MNIQPNVDEQDRPLANRYDFVGKVVIVTGAGSGIGRAVARGFLASGASVVVAGRRLAPLEETIGGAAEALAVPVDVSRRSDVRALIEATVGRFGRVDVIVSNAAIYAGGDLDEMSEGDWRQMFEVNVDGLFHLIAEGIDELRRTRGNLVAISSVSGLFGDWGQAAYNASKHAVTGLIRSAALDYGSDGVRLNAVAPAFTVTDMTEGVWGGDADLSAFTNRIALGRPGVPDDIVGPVLFLASQDAAYVTGSVLTADGGTSASSGQPHA